VSKSIKVRTSLHDGSVTVRMLVRHAMEVGGRRASGERVAPHYIREITCRHNDELVMLGHWGPGIAKNPYLSFIVGKAKSGDELVFRWVDNQGAIDELAMRI
jgi:sulfur-oxidizing protein SoxZ